MSRLFPESPKIVWELQETSCRTRNLVALVSDRWSRHYVRRTAAPAGGPPTAAEIAAEIAADTLLFAALLRVARAENKHAYHKVNTGTEFHRRWVGRRPQSFTGSRNAPSALHGPFR